MYSFTAFDAKPESDIFNIFLLRINYETNQAC